MTSTGDIFLAGGTLTVSSGAVVSNANAYIGYEVDGIVNVTGAGSQWNNSGDIQVGYYAFGFVSQLNITNGATVTSVNGVLAPYGDSETNAVVTVLGAGSSWTMSGDLTVGMATGGTLPNDTGGTLTISNGGVVSDVNGIIASSSVATLSLIHISTTLALTSTGSSSTNRNGWTLGTGVEWGFAAHWSAKLEYDYVHFNTVSYNATDTTALGVVTTPAKSATSYMNIVKAGVSYRF